MVGLANDWLVRPLLTLLNRLYPAEINGLALRSKGTALGTATNWIFNFMVVEITQIGIQSLQWKFYVSVQSTFESNARSLTFFDRSSGPSSTCLSCRSCTCSSSKPPGEHWKISTVTSATITKSWYSATRYVTGAGGFLGNSF